MTDNYPAFPSIPRLNRRVVITEKIDGENGLISIRRASDGPLRVGIETRVNFVDGDTYYVSAGTRTRWVTDVDNPFGGWVWERRYELVQTLGPGLHRGEWWGKGVKRGYGLNENRFSLFNVGRWTEDKLVEVLGLHVVPTIFPGTARLSTVQLALETLEISGSLAAPGFMRPEGVIVWHSAANSYFKVTLENDEGKGKS